MLVTHAFARSAASLLVAFGTLAMLAACDGPAHPPPQIPITVTTTDVAGPLTRGQNAVFAFTVTNPSSSSISGVTMITSAQPIVNTTAPLTVQGVTCAAQGTTCPAITAQGIQTTTMPAGSVLTFTVTTVVAMDYDGVADQQFEVAATSRTGAVIADAHATLADARDGYYELFSTSGRLASLTVHFLPGAMTFWVSSDNGPAAMQPDAGGYEFADGAHMVTLPDMLAGSYDFGNGPEPFIAAREMVATLAELDGTTFTTFAADAPAAGTATTSVFASWISGSTLTLCADPAPQTAATCPAASQRQYALTLDGVVFTGVDAQHGDTMTFQVAKSGSSRTLLRAEKIGTDGRFAVGLPSVGQASGQPQFLGNVGRQWTDVQLTPTTYATAPATNAGGAYGPIVALQAVAGGPPGLRQGTRSSDGVLLNVAESDALAVQLGAPGELDIFGLSVL